MKKLRIKSQKEMTCPKCSEFCVFHKEIEYEVEEQKYPCGKPVWQCGLCNFTLDRRTPKHSTQEAFHVTQNHCPASR